MRKISLFLLAVKLCLLVAEPLTEYVLVTQVFLAEFQTVG